MALSGPSGPRTTQIGLHSSLRLPRLPCIPRGKAEGGTLGAGILGQPVEQREAGAFLGLQLQLVAGLYDTQGLQKYKGPGQVLFWRGMNGTLSHPGYGTWEGGMTYGVSYLLVGF